MTIRVVLVDDEELVRFGLRTVLEAAGDFDFADGGVSVSLELPLSGGLVLLPDAAEPNHLS